MEGERQRQRGKERRKNLGRGSKLTKEEGALIMIGKAEEGNGMHVKVM